MPCVLKGILINLIIIKLIIGNTAYKIIEAINTNNTVEPLGRCAIDKTESIVVMGRVIFTTSLFNFLLVSSSKYCNLYARYPVHIIKKSIMS